MIKGTSIFFTQRNVRLGKRTQEELLVKNENQCHLSMIYKSWLWHMRMGHLNFENLVKISKKEVVRDFPKIVKPLNSVCKHC